MIWALSLAYTKLCPRVLTVIHFMRVFGVCLVSLPKRARQTIQCSTPLITIYRCAKTHFGENQLLPGSISFSLRTTTHPMTLSGQLVRASTLLSKSFTLVMVSSLWLRVLSTRHLELVKSASPCGGQILFSSKNALLTLGFPATSSY